jgi:hypothetical protein
MIHRAAPCAELSKAFSFFPGLVTAQRFNVKTTEPTPEKQPPFIETSTLKALNRIGQIPL